MSPRTQERLRVAGVSYADLTGNIRLELTEPGLFIDPIGARENPDPSPRDRKSLQGATAGRLVKALCDFRAPVGLRELAKCAGVDPGDTSRVVELLDREALVTRTLRGPITAVDWRGPPIWPFANSRSTQTSHSRPGSLRAFPVAIAGPAALLIAKLHKIAERVDARGQRRLEDKDALDILRLLQAAETPALAATITTLLQAEIARDVTREALAILRGHFTDVRAAGPQMAVRAAGALIRPMRSPRRA